MSDIKSFVILPDSKLDGSSVISVTEEAGVFVGQPVPDSDNVGSIMPFHSGRSLDRGCDIDYKITVAGGMNSAAEWVWKKEGDTQWNGYRDPRWGTDYCNPYNGSSYSGAPYGHSMFFSKVHSKLFITRVISGQTNKIEFAVRDITNQNIESYTLNLYDLKDASSTRGVRDADGSMPAFNKLVGKVDGLELPNGELRLFVTYQSSSTPITSYGSTRQTGGQNATEIAIYGSKDGGSNWYVVEDRVLQKFANAQYKTDWNADVFSGFECLKVAVSGDYMRMVLSTKTSSTGIMALYGFVSTDYGSTWKEFTNRITNLARAYPIDQGTLMDAYTAYTLVSGNDNGSFLLFYEYYSSTIYLQVKLGHMDNAFTILCGVIESTGTAVDPDLRANFFKPISEVLDPPGSFFQSSMRINSMSSCIGPNYIYLAISRVRNWSASDPIVLLSGIMIPRLTYSDPDTYIKWGEDISGCMKAQALVRTDIRLAWAGDRVAFSFGLAVPASDGGASSDYDWVVARSFGGNSKLPARRFEPISDNEENGFWTNNLKVECFGGLAVGGKGGWTTTNSVGFSGLTGFVDYRQLSNLASSSGILYNENLIYTNTAAMTNGNIMDGGVVGMIAKPSSAANFTSSSSSSYEFGFAVRTYSGITTGHSCLLGVAFYDDSSFKVIEKYVGSTNWSVLYTSAASSIDWSEYNDMRLVIIDGSLGSGSVEFVYKKIGDNEFKTSGLLSYDTTPSNWLSAEYYNSTGIGGDTQLGLFGFIDTSVPNFTWHWKEMFMTGTDTKNCYDCTNPDRVRGRLVSPVSTHVYDKVYAGWGGGGAVYDDDFNSKPSYSYGVDNIFTPSPSSFWRTKEGTKHAKTVTESSIVFDSNKGGTDGGQFIPDSYSLFKTSTSKMSISFSDDVNFSAGVFTTTIDTFVETGLVISSHTTNGNVIRLTTALTDHKYDGMILMITSGAQHGRAFRIDKNVGKDIYLSSSDTTALNYLTATTQVSIYDTQAVGVLDTSSLTQDTFRYMKLTFGVVDDSGSIRGTPESYHSLGSFVVGSTFTFTLPFDWETKDTEKSNLGISTFSSGAKTAIPFGPSRRTFSGKVFGDMDGFRDKWTRTIRAMSDFSVKPVTLVLDDTDMQSREKILYSRFQQEVVNDNVAWYKGSDGKYRRVGSFGLSFDEEV